MILQQFFSAGILFAMLGGVLGAVWASAKEHDTPFQFFIEAAVSAVAAAAVAENYLLLNQVWLCAISGAGVGLMTGTALDAAYALAPKISKGFVKGLLFALIGFSILNAFYMQVARICLYAFADKLRTFEGGIPAASDNRFAGRAADTGVAVGCFCLIAVATC